MLVLPAGDASYEEWRAFSECRCEDLLPHLSNFIIERFAYKQRYVQQMLWRSFGTVCGMTKQYDLYIRMFTRPEDFWPRECLTLARIGFKQQRVGHGRALVKLLVELAPKLGYRYIAIECANANASASARRLGFTSYEGGRHWVGEVDVIHQAIEQ